MKMVELEKNLAWEGFAVGFFVGVLATIALWFFGSILWKLLLMVV